MSKSQVGASWTEHQPFRPSIRSAPVIESSPDTMTTLAAEVWNGWLSMQLVVKRDQDDRVGVFGGHKGVDFSLNFQLILTPEESDLVRRYKFGDIPLGTWLYQGSEVPIATVHGAVAGRTMRWPSVVEMLSRERELKKACIVLKKLLDVASNFGGEDRFEITSDLDVDAVD